MRGVNGTGYAVVFGVVCFALSRWLPLRDWKKGRVEWMYKWIETGARKKVGWGEKNILSGSPSDDLKTKK